MKRRRPTITGTGQRISRKQGVQFPTLRLIETLLEQRVQQVIDPVLLHDIASLRSTHCSKALRIRNKASERAVGLCLRSAANSRTEAPGA